MYMKKRFAGFTAWLLLTVILGLIILPVCGGAEEASSDFLFIDNLKFRTDVYEQEALRSGKYVSGTEKSTGQPSITFNNLSAAGYPASLKLILNQNHVMAGEMRVNIPMLDSFIYHAEDYVFQKVTEEADQLYAGRSRVLFSSVEEMEEQFKPEKTYSDDSDMYFPGAIGMMMTYADFFKDKYNTDDYSCITGVKAWYVENAYVVMAIYGGGKFRAPDFLIVYADAYEIITGVGATRVDPDAFLRGRYRFPEGVDWDTTDSEILNTIEGAYLKSDGTIWLQGKEETRMFLMQDGKILVYYILPDGKSFETLKGELTEDYGEPIPVEESEETLRYLLGEDYEAFEEWIVGDVFVYLVKIKGQSIIMFRRLDMPS